MSNQFVEPCPSRSRMCSTSPLLNLPAEIRLMIFHWAFLDNEEETYEPRQQPDGLVLDTNYSAQTRLQALRTCRTLYTDAKHLALQHTTFVCSNLFTSIPDRLSLLPQAQVTSIRHITFVADARHFRQLATWGKHPFGLRDLQLETLTIALHRSSFWHYLFDFTAEIVTLLRTLHGLKRLTFVRNGALVKGSLRTWFNRLVGLMMKVDHSERYDRQPPRLEEIWWEWRYEEIAQRFWLEARPPKDWMDDHEVYLQSMLPLLEDLRISMEAEEFNPDPRSRMLYP